MQLILMNDAEFTAYLARTIPDYADEHVRAGNWSADEAEAKAADQIREILPDGVQTPDHYLYTLHAEEEAQPVGLIWFGLTRRGPRVRAFIYDIVVEEPFRRRGYASAALRAAEDKARELGADSLGLHVFGHNPGARALYQQLGFVETDIIMKKPL